MPGTVILPTFSGHFTQATNLIKTIRQSSGDVCINIIISKDDSELFKPYENDQYCKIKYIEDLIKQYSNIDISAKDLLSGIGKFRFQALKKILGVYYCETELALILDSETNIVKDLNEMFADGVEKTSVLYSLRQWDKIPESLTTAVRTEVNNLLDQQNDYWFFESFNWVYDVNLLKEMVSSIESRFGNEWIFRNTPLFECQLYYQYAFNNQSKYKFVRVEDLFIEHFGPEYGKKIIDRFWHSSFTFCGMIEYAAHLMSREEYIDFVTDPKVTHHLRLVRHEPPIIYDIVDVIRDKCDQKEYYGEAAMHRGDFTRGKIAVLISGEFHHLDNLLNIKNFLAGVDCNIFVATQKNSQLVPLINEVLSPIEIVAADDERLRGAHSKVLTLADGSPETNIKPGRDIGVTNMFDKLALAYQAMKKHQTESSEDYSIVVRIRPDIFSTTRLKDIFFDIAEHSQVDEKTVFFPDRFWSQGINDQFFFGKMRPMSTLLDNISGDNYLGCEYLNPEYFLGKTLLNLDIKPVAFEFSYILMRDQRINIHSIQHWLSDQERLFWSKKIPFSCWKNLSDKLSSNLSNIYVKNSQLEVSKIFTFRRKEIEFFCGKNPSGRIVVFTSEHKSPYLYASYVKKWHVPFLSYMLIFGYPYSITNVNNVVLNGYDKKSNQLEITMDKKSDVVSVFTPKPSFIAWGIVQTAKKFRRLLLGLARRIR